MVNSKLTLLVFASSALSAVVPREDPDVGHDHPADHEVPPTAHWGPPGSAPSNTKSGYFPPPDATMSAQFQAAFTGAPGAGPFPGQQLPHESASASFNSIAQSISEGPPKPTSAPQMVDSFHQDGAYGQGQLAPGSSHFRPPPRSSDAPIRPLSTFTQNPRPHPTTEASQQPSQGIQTGGPPSFDHSEPVFGSYGQPSSPPHVIPTETAKPSDVSHPKEPTGDGKGAGPHHTYGGPPPPFQEGTGEHPHPSGVEGKPPHPSPNGPPGGPPGEPTHLPQPEEQPHPEEKPPHLELPHPEGQPPYPEPPRPEAQPPHPEPPHPEGQPPHPEPPHPEGQPPHPEPPHPEGQSPHPEPPHPEGQPPHSYGGPPPQAGSGEPSHPSVPEGKPPHPPQGGPPGEPPSSQPEEHPHPEGQAPHSMPGGAPDEPPHSLSGVPPGVSPHPSQPDGQPPHPYGQPQSQGPPPNSPAGPLDKGRSTELGDHQGPPPYLPAGGPPPFICPCAVEHGRPPFGGEISSHPARPTEQAGGPPPSPVGEPEQHSPHPIGKPADGHDDHPAPPHDMPKDESPCPEEGSEHPHNPHSTRPVLGLAPSGKSKPAPGASASEHPGSRPFEQPRSSSAVTPSRSPLPSKTSVAKQTPSQPTQKTTQSSPQQTHNTTDAPGPEKSSVQFSSNAVMSKKAVSAGLASVVVGLLLVPFLL